MADSPPNIGVVGTVGVPARYGGFETLAEQLARNISPNVAVMHCYGQKSAYTSAEREGSFAGHPRHFLPLLANGLQSMAHDALAMLHAALVLRVDVLLVLGVSGAWFLPLLRLLRPSLRIVTNVDGLEWRRNKFGAWAKRLLKVLEWLAIKTSHTIIADNAGLVPLVSKLYGIEPVLIAYGGDQALVPPATGDMPKAHWLVVARIEPENNSEMILEAAAIASVPLIIVGNWDANDYGRTLKTKWQETSGLMLMNPIYDLAVLARLRSRAIGYVHGHSIGGTNPSLVEALFTVDRILAFDCPFNRATLGGMGEYFTNAASLAEALRQPASGGIPPTILQAMRDRYRWRNIASEYIAVLLENPGRQQLRRY